MLKLKKIFCLLMAVAVLMGCAAMSGCQKEPGGDTTGGDSGQTEYKVALKDYQGNPVGSGAVAVFYQGETQVAMQVCDANGVATKSLATGEYDVKLQFTSGDTYYYKEEGMQVSASAPELDITLYSKTADQSTLYIPHREVDEYGLTFVTNEEANVYNLNEGCTYVEVKPGEMTYFLFTPARGGMYELSVVDQQDCVFGYYGSPNYISETPLQDIVDGISTVNIEETAVTGDPDNTIALVMAVSSEESTGCVVCINRVGDAAWNPSQEEWIIYETTADLSDCVLPEGTELKNFDLSQTYNLVYNPDDGFYHLDSADGKLVYVYLTKNPRFVDCFQTILEEGTVRAYFYDDDGNFVKKEAYGQCLKEYFPYADAAKGVYPLTKDLEYIIQSFGTHMGWWDASSGGYIMSNYPNLNVDSAWLFMCCYAE